MTWVQIDDLHAVDLEHGRKLEIVCDQQNPCHKWQLRLSDPCCCEYVVIVEDCKPKPIVDDFNTIIFGLKKSQPLIDISPANRNS